MTTETATFLLRFLAVLSQFLACKGRGQNGSHTVLGMPLTPPGTPV